MLDKAVEKDVLTKRTLGLRRPKKNPEKRSCAESLAR